MWKLSKKTAKGVMRIITFPCRLIVLYEGLRPFGGLSGSDCRYPTVFLLEHVFYCHLGSFFLRELA